LRNSSVQTAAENVGANTPIFIGSQSFISMLNGSNNFHVFFLGSHVEAAARFYLGCGLGMQ
jgi:hypothetical protein